MFIPAAYGILINEKTLCCGRRDGGEAMFERPLLYLVPPYAAMLLIVVRSGLVPSPFLCLPALAVLLIGAAFAVRHR